MTSDKHSPKVAALSFMVALALAALLFGLVKLAGAQGPGTAFTYQGRLLQSGHYVNDVSCDFEFRLYDSLTEGNQLGYQTANGVPVSDGYFTVDLDLGDVFSAGSLRYLETSVQCPGDTGFTPLTPRVTLRPAPYAQYSQSVPWSGISGMPAGFADGIDDGWSLTGNGGTNPATNFLGTTDDQALVLGVNGNPALRLGPDATSPNVIGGYRDNSVTAGVHGATIGGGSSDAVNRVTNHYGTVGGGQNNAAAAQYATIGGGQNITAASQHVTIGGGRNNEIGVESQHATIGGGGENNIGYGADYATIGGGQNNSVADYADYAFAAGRRAKANHAGSFVWADSTDADFASEGVNQFRIRASGGVDVEGTASQRLTDEGFVKAWARINANGTIAACYNCNTNSAETRWIGVGRYEVDFLLGDIGGRPRLATLDTDGTTPVMGFISLSNHPTDDSSVHVFTVDMGGAFQDPDPADRAFTLIIY